MEVFPLTLFFLLAQHQIDYGKKTWGKQLLSPCPQRKEQAKGVLLGTEMQQLPAPTSSWIPAGFKGERSPWQATWKRAEANNILKYSGESWRIRKGDPVHQGGSAMVSRGKKWFMYFLPFLIENIKTVYKTACPTCFRNPQVLPIKKIYIFFFS